MYAAQEGHTKVVELLLQYEASVDLKLRVSVWPRVGVSGALGCGSWGECQGPGVWWLEGVSGP